MNDSVNKLFTIAMDKEWAYTAELRIWFLGKLSQGFGGAILIPGFCSPKALKPLLPVFLSELEDLADGFAAVERVAIDARPCMANQVHHLRLADDGVDFNCASIVCLDERKAWMRSTRCRSC